MSFFTDTLNEIFHKNNLDAFADKSEQLEDLFNELTETNKIFNLTSVTDPEGVCLLHFCDSLTLCKYLTEAENLLDIGCGAGFPSLPVALAMPELTVTGLDSTGKKTDFANAFAKKYGVSNFNAVNGRAEELAKGKLRGTFNAVTARAVSKLNLLAEIALPFLKEGGILLSMKGPTGSKEAEEAADAINICGGRTENIVILSLRTEKIEVKRSIIIVRKERPTPEKYPRSYPKMLKNPL